MAQQVEKIDQNKDYTVQAGDTRKSIAERAYNNANKWKLIYNANKKQLENLHNRPLPAGMILQIPREGVGGGGDIH